MKRTFFITALCLLFVLISSGHVWAQIPETISYQGVLADASSGTVVPDGNYQLTFRLYDAATGGNLLWTEVFNSVAVGNGVFNVLLASTVPFNLPFDKQYWLEVQVVSDPPLAPRIQLAASPYSLNSQGGTGDGHSLDAADGSQTDVVFVDNDGKVGIGTTSPEAKLEVNGNLLVGSGAALSNQTGAINLLAGTNGDKVSAIAMQGSRTTDATFAEISMTHKNSAQILIRADREGTDDAANLQFFTARGGNTTERLRITSTGNVGIGTTSPGGRLEVKGSHTETLRLHSNATGGEGFDLEWFSDFSGGKTTAIIESDASGTQGGNLWFKVRDQATNAVVDRMVIDNAGNVGIGTFSPTVRLQLPNSIFGQGLAFAWNTYSSRRWKTNVKTIEDALEKVQRLRGVAYDSKEDGTHHIGLIAEEVGEVVPEVVSYEENGEDAKAIDYSRLVAVLIEAVKEQQEQIEELKDTIKTLVATK